MDNSSTFKRAFVTARYTSQRIPQFKGNPLIEALPPTMTDEDVTTALMLTPEFDSAQREWETCERLMMLGSLANFMVPFARHHALARSLDTLIRTGYVGRIPRTTEHTEIFQQIYENQKAGISFRQSSTTLSAQLSSALLGPSGTGKSTSVGRYLAHFPPVIYHPELCFYQIPYLHVEMPSDGSSVKGLAYGILRKIDELIPEANYYHEYAIKGRPGAEMLMQSVARVMNMHLVGLLVCDEVQNLANSFKGAEIVMTELVSACNALKVPILFIGTNKATKVLSLDFRQARRSSGHGFEPWLNLPEYVPENEVNDWEEFLDVLWRYQWTKKPVLLDDQLAGAMYYYSQGVIDLAIKLFVSAQARAMADGSETISAELIADVYKCEFQLLHPMVDALRNNDYEALANFSDIAPLQLDDILQYYLAKIQSKGSAVHRIRPGDDTFVPRVAATLESMGYDSETALTAAQTVESAGTASNMTEGVKQAIASLTVPRRVSRGKMSAPAAQSAVDFSARPNDYRRAVQEARASGTSKLQKLKELGMAPHLEEVLELAG
ncbi:MAG: AAA family ATPase [Gallionella sp.]|jgi:hypothetical protein